MTDGSGTTTYTYVPAGTPGALQVQQVTTPLTNGTIAYTYDALGRLSTRTVAGQGAESYGYDPIGRVTSHASDLGSFTLAWLGQSGQIVSRSLASSSLATSWTYLANASDRRLASVATTGTQFNQSTSFAYTTNAQNEATGLTQTSDATVATPAVSTQSASYNNLNQLTNLSGQAQTFDADGNLTSDGTRTYSWDAENQLIAIAYPGQGSKATAFAYDGLGRRIQWSSTPRTGGAVITNYIWCGSSLCQARNSSNAVIRGYYAEGEYTPGGFSHDNYYAPDRLGSVRRVFTTTLSSTYDYDAYGAALQTTAPTTDVGYAAMVTNTDSGLYLTTARPYDPATGRFLTRDPIGEAGDPEGNLYVYAGSNPVAAIDPLGLASFLVIEPVIGGGSHTFIVVSNSLGGTPQAQFSYGPTDIYGALGLQSEPLSEQYGVPGSMTNEHDRQTWNQLDNPANAAANGIVAYRLKIPDANVICAGRQIDRILGTPSNPGNESYTMLPELPGQVNSNSATNAILHYASPTSSFPTEDQFGAQGIWVPGWDNFSYIRK